MAPGTTPTMRTTGAPSSRWQASAQSPQRQPNVQFFSFPWQGGSFPAQLCEQDFEAYECSVISDDTMQAVGAGILNESPRSADPRH
ncbi:unnamed protein product [Pelagomonas calceolata]|uniref:Uncharacterized protein n=1 Tax=Pelagomonas calceolata TaxID=35677 RepID=A0A8J2X240_9STRA|nr:unnamed protein product [Pelagomonas calceolata]